MCGILHTAALIRARSNRHTAANFYVSCGAGGGGGRLLNDWSGLDGIEQVQRGSFRGGFLGLQG